MFKENPKKALKITFIITFILGILLYSYYQARFIIGGPKLTVLKPKDGEILKNPMVHIEGITSHASVVTLNDRELFISENGDFRENLLLFPGYNIMKLEAKDRFGRTIEKTLELVYQN